MTPLHFTWKTKSSAFLLLAVVSLALAPGAAHAVSYSTLYIQGPGDTVLVNSPLTFPEDCTVLDDGGNPHSFTGHKAVCAIHEAREQGLITSYEFIDFGFGLFLNAVNGIATPPDFSESWQVYRNGESASVGVGDLVISTCSVLQLTYGPWPTPIAGEAAACEPEGGVLTVAVVSQSLQLLEAVDFLLAQQEEDGSFGSPLFSDWAAVALGAYDKNHEASKKLAGYLAANPDPGPSLGHPVLSFERRAMAVMALGLNPYTATSVNYIESIAASFDGTQLGAQGLMNDDIFGLLVLKEAGYGNEELIGAVVRFLLESQEENGSFGGADMTAAAIQALSLVSSVEGVAESLQSAEQYLREQQGDDGGFGNADSTSWAMQAMAALGHLPWEKSGGLPPEFLASFQQEDGGIAGVSDELRTWSTSYAIPSSLWKSWPDILVNAEQPELLPESVGVERVIEGDEGKLVVRDITAVKVAGEGVWNGAIEFVPALSLEEAMAVAEGFSFLDPVGAAVVTVGENVFLELATPATLFIPVFAEEGEELHAYVSSEGAFSYLASCVAQDGLCIVETPHFSTFVVARQKTEIAGTAQEAVSTLTLQETQAELEALRQEIATLRSQVALLQESSQVASERMTEEASLQQEEEDAQQDKEVFTAAVGGGGSTGFFSSGLSQILLVVMIGLGLFLVLGGWKNMASFMRRRPSPARYEPPVFTGRYGEETSL